MTRWYTRLLAKAVTKIAFSCVLMASIVVTCLAADQNSTSIAYIDVLRDSQPGVPTYLARPDNEGFNGAQIAIVDANRTGKFVGYTLSLSRVQLIPSSALSEESSKAIQAASVVLIDANAKDYADTISKISQSNPNALLINVANQANSARGKHCEIPILHTIPTFQMKTDALGQWFRTKRIGEIYVLKGNHPEDETYTDAFIQTAKKFKLNIVEVKQWQQSFDLRRSAFSEIPLFTRSDNDYEAVFASDADAQFAYSLPFNTHQIVPITGDAGLQPRNWHRTHEQWGARQLQNRFNEEFKRDMNDVDFAAYAAVIAVSTALQQGAANNGMALYKTLLAENMAIAAYKGRKLSFRAQTRQLRQPILLAHEDALVTHAPLTGFLHQTNDLDTLGTLTSACKGTRL